MIATEAQVDELELFADFCAGLTIESGLRMVLEDFQRKILRDFFDGAAETVALLSKKNGKSTLLSAVALYSLCTRPELECVIAATSRDQASIILGQCRGFVRRSEGLKSRLRVNQREISHSTLGGRVRVIAADSDTVDGWLGDLALVDELHRARSIELYSILREGVGPRDGRLITITTAGDSELGPLGVLRTRAYELPTQRRDGAYRYARSANGRFAWHEWALDTDQDYENLELVKQANPASWQTIERIQDRRASPSMTIWQFRRFACGQWVKGENSAIQPEEWDALAVPGTTIPNGSPIWLGWDHAWRGGGDTCAIVPLWWQSDERRVIGDPTILEAAEGAILDDQLVVNAFNSFSARWRIEGVIYDPSAGASGLAQRVARDGGLKLVEHSQRDAAMALADGRLLEAIRRRQLVHSGDPILREHVLNAVEKPVQGELFRFTRPKHGPRVPIDGLTALSMCHSTAVAEASAPKQSNDWFMF